MTSSTTDAGVLAARRRARADLAHGDQRAGARSHFRAMGIDPDRLDGPDRRHRVDVDAARCRATSTTATSRRRSSRASTPAGGVALTFNTIAVSDNQSQATPGMRASLVSRELIADSIELMDIAHDFDALVCIVGCDKTVPAALMALARIDKPAVVVYSGPMRAGRWRGERATIQEVWEAVGARRQGKLERAELDELERSACPGPGTCAGHFTANTMGLALEFLGLAAAGHARWSPPTSSSSAREHAAEAGALAVRLAGDGAPARGLPRRAASLLNAMTGIAASGGSTNGVLHLLAIAREAGVELTLDDLFERAAATPVIANLTPGGRYVATDLHAAGGVPGPDPRADPRGPRRRRRAGRRRRHARRRGRRRAGPRRRASRSRATRRTRPRAASAACAATSRPTAPWPRSPAPSAAATPAPRACSSSEDACIAAIAAERDRARRRPDHPQRGPGRRPRHARDAERHRRRRRRRASASPSCSSPTAASPARPAA